MHVDLGQGHTPAFCALAEPQTAPFHVCAGFKPPDEIGGEYGWMVNFPFLRFRETSLPFHINGTRWHDSSCAGKNFRTERAGGINDECSNLNTAGYPSHQCIQRCEREACLGHTNIPFFSLKICFCSVIQGVQKRGEELLSNVRNTDMGPDQMWEKLGMLAKQKCTFRLDALNDSRKIIKLESRTTITNGCCRRLLIASYRGYIRSSELELTLVTRRTPLVSAFRKQRRAFIACMLLMTTRTWLCLLFGLVGPSSCMHTSMLAIYLE